MTYLTSVPLIILLRLPRSLARAAAAAPALFIVPVGVTVTKANVVLVNARLHNPLLVDAQQRIRMARLLSKTDFH